MVQIASRFIVLFSCVVLGLSSSLRRTVGQLKSTVDSISTQVTDLDNEMKAFPLTGGSYLAFWAINRGTRGLSAALAAAANDVKLTGPLEDQDGSEILDTLQAIEPLITSALEQAVVKNSAFRALLLGIFHSLIFQDLKNLNDNTVLFSNALISTVSANRTSAATTLRDNIVDAFTPAMAAYS